MMKRKKNDFINFNKNKTNPKFQRHKNTTQMIEFNPSEWLLCLKYL